MKRFRGAAAQIAVGLAVALTGCITNDRPPPAPRVAHPPTNGLTDAQVHWYLEQGFHEFWSCWAEATSAESRYARLDISISKEGTVATANLVNTTFDSPSAIPCIED